MCCRAAGGRGWTRRDRRSPPAGSPEDYVAGAGAGDLDPIALQVLVGALRAACEEMGAVLIRAAHSANIKERRDCSTALFDARRARW